MIFIWNWGGNTYGGQIPWDLHRSGCISMELGVYTDMRNGSDYALLNLCSWTPVYIYSTVQVHCARESLKS